MERMKSLKRLQNESPPTEYRISLRKLALISLSCALLVTHYLLLPLVQFISSALALPEEINQFND
jgi:hypothetical protein